jgi:hypothetical protein
VPKEFKVFKETQDFKETLVLKGLREVSKELKGHEDSEGLKVIPELKVEL